jgi:hypothetical protein
MAIVTFMYKTKKVCQSNTILQVYNVSTYYTNTIFLIEYNMKLILSFHEIE